MEYNAILRNQSSTISEKEAAFVFFIKKYQKDAKNFAHQKIKKYVSFLPEQGETAREIVQEAAILMLQKIRNGILCYDEPKAEKTGITYSKEYETIGGCETWLNQLMTGLIKNLSRKESALKPQKNEEEREFEQLKKEAKAAGKPVPKKEIDPEMEAEKQTATSRIIDFDKDLIKVLKTDNKIEQSHLHDDLRYKLDALIHEVSATCKEYFAVLFADEEDLFAWWRQTRAKDQNIDDPIVLKKLRSSFDATTSNCRGKMRELILKYNIKFF